MPIAPSSRASLKARCVVAKRFPPAKFSILRYANRSNRRAESSQLKQKRAADESTSAERSNNVLALGHQAAKHGVAQR